MQIFVDTTFPIGLLIALFGALSMMTVMLYRRMRLDTPWSFWLPVLRILAYALLLLAFIQPVLVRTAETEERGRIAVILDNSGSMSIGDDYTLPRQVEVCSSFHLFSPELRNSSFGDDAVRLANISATMRTVSNRLESLVENIQRKNLLEQLNREQEIRPALEEAATDLVELAKRLRESPEGYPYLQENMELKLPQKEKRKSAKGLLYKRWEKIDGWEIKDLTESPKFQEEPDQSEIIDKFDVPRNVGSAIGVLVQGYIHPPETGNYQFYFCSDDQGELYLSSSESPKDIKRIARCRAYSPYGKMDTYPDQTSEPIRLEADRSYYVEALMKEHVGDDHLLVGWKRPSGKKEIPIPGEHLSPFGVLVKGYGGPRFAELYPQATQELAEIGKQLNRLQSAFAEYTAEEEVPKRLKTLKGMAKTLKKLTQQLDDTYAIVSKLQEAADYQLARAGNQHVDVALERFTNMKRIDIAKWILNREPFDLLDKLNAKGVPQVFALDPKHRDLNEAGLVSLKATLPRTDLSSVYEDVFKLYENQLVAGIIVLSDGNQNAGKDLREVKEVAREREVPLIAIGIGSERLPKDIAIDTVVAPSTSFRNNTTQISVVLKRDGFANRPVTLRLVSEGKTLHTKVIPPGSESRVNVDMSFVESRDGILEYAIRAQIFEDEEIKHNNSKSFQISILKDPIATLLVDEFPRWETRFCSMMLHDDKRFKLRTIFTNAMQGSVLRTGPNGWPEDRDALNAFQILIIGDVNPENFTVSQMEDIRSFVVDRGGAVVFLAGPNYMPSGYKQQPLADLFPFSIPKTTDKANGGGTDLALALTEESQYDPLLQIAGTPEISKKLWTQLPQPQWVMTGIIPSRAADLVLTTEEQNSPVLLKSNVGLGKVLYIGSDSFWRWRREAKSEYHLRMWGQFLLWATLGRTTGTDRYIKFITSRPEYTPGEPIEVTARILNESNLPLKNAHATVEVFDHETGRIVKVVEMKFLPGSGGKYTATLTDLPRGKYRISPVVQELPDSGSVEATFEIRDLPTSEYIDLALNVPVLKGFSDQYLPYERADEVFDMIEELEVPRQHRTEYELWDSMYFILAVTILLGLEWLFRKRQQLV